MTASAHKAEARKLLARSDQGTVPEDDTAFVIIAQAQTHATLALVDTLEELVKIVKNHP